MDLPPPLPSIEFNLSSKGMSKGLAQTDGPQALVRGELAFGRVYLGAYAKNVTSGTADGEAGALVGMRARAGGFDVAASAAWKRAIDPSRGSDTDALELAASLGRRFGSVTPRLSVVWSPNDVGSTGRTTFVELGSSYRFGKAFTASGALGRRERQGGLDYTAWNAGVAWNPIQPLSLDVRYYDTGRAAGQPYRARLVASARLKF